MEKRSAVIIIISISIISITATIIGVLSPDVYMEQCKQKVRELVNIIESIEGDKENFHRLFQQGTLSPSSQNNLQHLRNVLEHCPELKNLSAAEVGVDISFLE